MQAETLQAAHRPPEIERTRVAVALPPDATSSGEALFVPITWEDTNDDGVGVISVFEQNRKLPAKNQVISIT